MKLMTLGLGLGIVVGWVASLQQGPREEQVRTHLLKMASIPAVSGHESKLAAYIMEHLPAGAKGAIDNLGNVTVTYGSGKGGRVLAAAMDEPGVIVSGITEDGYLRVRLVPSRESTRSEWPRFLEGQVVMVGTEKEEIPGMMVVSSTHLRGDRPEKIGEEHLWVDVGCKTPEEVAARGITTLCPVSLRNRIVELSGGRVGGVGLGRRAGCAALLLAVLRLKPSELKGNVSFVWLAQDLVGRRGASRMIEALQPSAVYWIDAMPESESDTLGMGAPRWKNTERGEMRGKTLGMPTRYGGSALEVIDLRDVEEAVGKIVEAAGEG